MKPTTANQILDTLQYSSDQYEEQYLEWFDRWCTVQSKNQISLFVQIFQNGPVSKWFAHEFEKLEQTFLAMSKAMPKDTVQLRMHYKIMITQIFNIYPKALLDEIKPNKEFKHPLNLN